MAEIESLTHLAEQFGRLSGIGRKSAFRMAYSVLDFSDEEAEAFAAAILEAKRNIHLCPVCQNLTDRELCSVCNDLDRDRSVICVVEDAKAVMSIEKVREYRGMYHVLHGVISPVNGIGADQLKIRELVHRVASEDIEEVILATSPNVEGQATALYLNKLLKPFEIKVTGLALGIPVGGTLEYADSLTLTRAMENRRSFE